MLFDATTDRPNGDSDNIFNTIIDGVTDVFAEREARKERQAERSFISGLLDKGVPFSAFGFSGSSGTGLGVDDPFDEGQRVNLQAIGVLIAFAGLVLAALTFFRK